MAAPLLRHLYHLPTSRPGKEVTAESKCGLPPPWSSEEGLHSDSGTPLRLTPQCRVPAVHHQDLQGALANLALRHTPLCTTTSRSTCGLGPGDGNILPYPPALVLGPAEDAGLVFNTDPGEELNLSNDGLYRDPAGLFLDYCQHLRDQEQQQEPRAGGGTPLCQVAGPGSLPR